MLKKEFHYTDYDGNEKTLTAYFRLTKNDCIDLNNAFANEGGLVEYLKKLLDVVKKNTESDGYTPVQDSFVRFVRLLVSKAYGERPAFNPSLFLKEDDFGNPLIRNFKGTPAYDDFVWDLLTSANGESLSDFCEQIMPQIDDSQRAEADKYLKSEGIDFAELKAQAAQNGLHEV